MTSTPPRCAARLLVAAVALGSSLAPVSHVLAQRDSPPPRSARTVLSPRVAEIADAAAVDATIAAIRPGGAGSAADDAPDLLHDPDGRLLVDVTFNDGGAGAVPLLTRLGASLVATDSGSVIATVAVPQHSLRAVALLPGVSYLVEIPEPVVGGGGARPVSGARPAATTPCSTGVVTEGDGQLRAGTARSTYGVDGTGVLVGVLSDSYDDRGGAITDVMQSELPGTNNPCGRTDPVAIRGDATSGMGTDEGRAMAQIVHDLAPGADLVFSTAFRGELAMARAVTDLGVAGADVITDDVSYLLEPMFQDGWIASAINRNRTDRNISHYTAAGNSNVVIAGNDVSSYEAPAFRPAPCPRGLPSGIQTCHDFDPAVGVDAGNGLTLAPKGSITLVAGWSEPMYGVTTDLDLFLVDTVTGAVVASGQLDNSTAGTARPSEYVMYTNGTGAQRTFDVVIGRHAGTAGTPRLKHVLVRSTGLSGVERSASVGGDVVGPSLIGHSAAGDAVVVAAVGYDGDTRAEAFSSRGPASRCWQPVEPYDGAAHPPRPAISPCQVTTIDIAATDGGANSFFGSSAAGTRRFFGTSAAAPHAAAVAALARSYRPCISADTLEQAMRSGARAVGTEPPGAVGAGLVDAAATLSGLSGACVPGTIPPSSTTTPSSTSPSSTSPSSTVTPTSPSSTPPTSTPPTSTPPTSTPPTSTVAPTSTTGPQASTGPAASFHTLTPTRYADSRDESTFDGRFRDTGSRPAGSTWEVPVAGRGVVPTSATAAIVNLTVLDGTAPGFATAFPCGQPPDTSSVNFDRGSVESNEVVVGLSDAGTLCVFTLASAHVVLDVVGWLDVESGYVAIAPARFADSRDEATFDGTSRNTGQRPGGTTWEIPIAGRSTIPTTPIVPTTATSVIANITVTGAHAPGYATVHPCGTPPDASTVNYDIGITRPNEIVAKLSPTGTICITTLTDVDVIVDVVGWLGGSAHATTATPLRFADSRHEATFDGTSRDTGQRPGGTTWEIPIAGRSTIPTTATSVIANITVTGAHAPGYATVHPCGTPPDASTVNYDIGITRPNEIVAKLSPTGTICITTLTDVDVIVDVVGWD